MKTLFIKELNATINLDDAKKRVERMWVGSSTNFIEGEYPVYDDRGNYAGNLEAICETYGGTYVIVISSKEYDIDKENIQYK